MIILLVSEIFKSSFCFERIMQFKVVLVLVLFLFLVSCNNKEAVTTSMVADVSTLTVAVVDENGSPIGDAQVYLDGVLKGQTREFGTGQGTKTFVISGDETEIKVAKEGYISPKPVKILNQLGEQKLTVTLESERGALAVFVSSEKQPVRGALVTLTSNNSQFKEVLSTDNRGIADFGKVGEGQFYIKVSKPEYEIADTTITLQTKTKKVVTVPLYSVPELTLEVQDSREQPINGAEISIYFKSDYNSPNGKIWQLRTTTEDGIAVVKEMLRGLEYVLVIKKEGYDAAIREITATGHSKLLVQLQAE